MLQWGASNEYPQHIFTWRNKFKKSIPFGWKNPIMIFVCVEVFSRNAVSLPNHTFNVQAKSSKQLTNIVHILLPETDNCPSWISGRERMTVENISWSISTKECCRPGDGPIRNHLITSWMHIQLSHLILTYDGRGIQTNRFLISL